MNITSARLCGAAGGAEQVVDLGPDRPTRRLVHVTTTAARHSPAVRELRADQSVTTSM
ncbi:hypothetical protein [Lentzea aerocolonigenes]|uniref:hypothetical protein n=1 Tax=Lentzea aerocolonigenes TaxID=68170 RepID=UPI0012E0E7BF|nr:hypothetical protein [Lentzea aerocolonigenes]